MDMNIFLLRLCTVFLILVGLGLILYHNTAAQENYGIKIVNETDHIKVDSIKKEGDTYIITFKNVFDRNINGYTLATNQKVGTADLTIGSHLISPGEAFAERYPASAFRPSDKVKDPTLFIKAVFFEDGSSDGDKKSIRQTTQRRVGQLMELERVLQILNSSEDQSSISASNKSASTDLESMKARIYNSSVELIKNRKSSHIKAGIRHVHQDVIQFLDNIHTSKASAASTTDSPNNDMQMLKRMLEKRVRNLKHYSKLIPRS
jgi:hypothetical protein